MDAHYHKVMNARKNVTDKTNKLYFAYSTILDREAFEDWKNHHSYQFFQLPEGKVAEAIDTDLVFDFQSRWWGGRVAGLVEKKGSRIFGRLFEVPAVDWPIVQHKEGAVTGMCIERSVRVLVDGKEVEAVAFTTNPERAKTDGPVSEDFIKALVHGAKQAGLPADYIERIQKLLP